MELFYEKKLSDINVLHYMPHINVRSRCLYTVACAKLKCKASSGIDGETLSGIDRETLSGIDGETLSGIDRETLSGIDRETLSGIVSRVHQLNPGSPSLVP